MSLTGVIRHEVVRSPEQELRNAQQALREAVGRLQRARADLLSLAPGDIFNRWDDAYDGIYIHPALVVRATPKQIVVRVGPQRPHHLPRVAIERGEMVVVRGHTFATGRALLPILQEQQRALAERVARCEDRVAHWAEMVG